jgi:endo-1,3-1,4-beta-glycanase ExoK
VIHSILPSLLLMSALQGATVRIVELRLPDPLRLSGEVAEVRLSIEGSPRTRYWVGYSVQDPSGGWHDVPAVEATTSSLGRLEASRAWAVPASAPNGFYRVVVAVWDREPDQPGATRLAGLDRSDAFRVAGSRDTTDALQRERWFRGAHPLGRGAVQADRVRTDGGVSLLLTPEGGLGAELRSVDRHGTGRYSVRMRTPRAPGSLSAFFLYQDVLEGNDEVDLEILNDGSRRVILATWVAGEKTRDAVVQLPFDPADASHEYEIELQESRVSFRADGQLLAEWSEGVPRRPMRVVVNSWWPIWLTPAGTSGETRIDWIRYRSTSERARSIALRNTSSG